LVDGEAASLIPTEGQRLRHGGIDERHHRYRYDRAVPVVGESELHNCDCPSDTKSSSRTRDKAYEYRSASCQHDSQSEQRYKSCKPFHFDFSVRELLDQSIALRCKRDASVSLLGRCERHRCAD